MREFKVNLTGEYNTRLIVGATPSTKDRRYINCFPHIIDQTAYIVKRIGFATYLTPSVGNPATAILSWSGNPTTQVNIVAAFTVASNSTLYYNGNSIGAITGQCTGITETFVGTEATIVLTSTDNTAWLTSSAAVNGGLTFVGSTTSGSAIVTGVSSIAGLVVGQAISGTGIPANTRILTIDSATQITMTINATATNAGITITRAILGKIIDADFPGNATYTLAGTFAHMDGYAVIMTTDGKIWASDLNTVTKWTATSFDSTNAHPDRGVGCVRHKNFILAFGTESLEAFYNAGLTPFPFAKSVTQTQKIGAINNTSANTITSIADTIYFCGSTSQGGISIFEYNGSVGRISTPEIDNTLALQGTVGIRLTTFRTMGLSFLVVNTDARSYVYCIENKSWHEWTNATQQISQCVGLSTTSDPNTVYFISKTGTSGKIYKFDPAAIVYTDDGVAYTATIQTDNSTYGTGRKKFFSELNIICDRETSASAITLSYTDDDYQTFTTYGNLDLSNDRPRATRLGASRKRAWKLEHSANTGFRIEALQGMMEIGQ